MKYLIIILLFISINGYSQHTFTQTHDTLACGNAYVVDSVVYQGKKTTFVPVYCLMVLYKTENGKNYWRNNNRWFGPDRKTVVELQPLENQPKGFKIPTIR